MGKADGAQPHQGRTCLTSKFFQWLLRLLHIIELDPNVLVLERARLVIVNFNHYAGMRKQLADFAEAWFIRFSSV